jgi:hypothetical protein
MLPTHVPLIGGDMHWCVAANDVLWQHLRCPCAFRALSVCCIPVASDF